MKSKILLKILMPFFFLLTAFTAVAQSITPSGSITTFTTTYGTDATEQSFTFIAAGLTASSNVVVTAPANFEVSLTSGSGFAASVNVPTDGSGNVASATIYVRLPGSVNPGSIGGGNITLVEGSTNNTVAIPASTVNVKPLTITGLTANNKNYDGLTTATLSGTATLNGGLVGSDVVTISAGTANFASKTVGTGKTVTATGFSLSGADAAKYSVTQPTIPNADITAINLTITGLTATSRAYNGLTTATLAGTAALSGVVSGDVVTIDAVGTASFADKTVGTAKPVTVIGYTINGADAANYTLIQPAGLTADITAINLTITGLTATSRAYNGLTTATLAGTAALSGVVSGDVVTIDAVGTASFATKTVGTAKPVTVIGYTINGGDAANYTLTQPAGLTADITAIALTISGVTADNRLYNGLTAATLTGTAALVGVVSGDAVTLGGTAAASFATATVGLAKAVTVTGYSISGADAANYTLTQPTGLTADITPAPLTITADSVRKYHGETIANPSTGVTAFTSTGLVNGETIGSVTMTYVTGDASGDPLGLTLNAVIPSAATGGTFTAINYTINYVANQIRVIPNINAFLSNLVASTGPLNTAFNKYDLDYDTYVLTAINTFTVTPTVENQFATIQARIDTGMGPGAYVPLTSGVASAPFTIREGDNIIEILVTAEDGINQLNYRILYRRESSFVSGGGGGGLESKSLGDAIAQRVLNNAINDMNGAVDYNKLPVVETAQGTIRSASTNSIFSLQLSSIMPDLSNRGYKAYNSSPVDIVSFTNAKEVFAVDYVNTNKETKAVAFTTKTLGELYDHTKPICDRLKGATLLDVESVKIDGYDFINYTIRNDKGNLEYATAFTVGAKAGRNNFNLQSAFLTTSYVNEDQMYNFQIWAASPTIVNDMVKEVLAKLKDVAPVNQSIVNASPDTYIESGKREGANLNLVIKNGTAATTGFFKFEDRSNESSTGIVTRNVPFTVNANGTSTISVPVGDKYESSISMFLNGEVKDMLYMSDGTWAIDYNRNTTSVSAFTVTNDAKRTISANEFPVLRNVEVKANSSDFVSLFKLLKAGGMEADLSGYAGLKFTAAGGYNLRVTMVQNGISEWKNQYTTDIRLGSGQQEYFIPFSQFKSAASAKNIDPKDVTTLVFTVEVNAGRNSPIASTFSNISFTKEKPALNTTEQEEKTIQVFPNPVTDNVFTASFVSPVAGELTMKINDASGRS
ncbi:YDG domain-containing protein, partial [Sediminibacterium salmoneum]|uniref:YDG domain-containing protein n=1 Tax=Sediminibacterium salmoneum TaxID=426421 RepID=UPI00155ABF8F